MAEWIFNQNGNPTIILDNDCMRNNRGQVIAWISSNNIYSLHGQHLGWYEDGVFTDSKNCVLGFLNNATGQMPPKPGFSARPGRSGFSGIPGRSGRGGWSNKNLSTYFTE